MPWAARRDALFVCLSIFLITGSVNLAMPLFRDYAAGAGKGTGLTSLVFCAYVAGLLPALIGLSGLSDRLGRKPVLLAASALSFTACLFMAVHPGLSVQWIARPLQGLAVGISVSAGTAYLSERLAPWKSHAWVSAVMAGITSIGFGAGALFTASLLLFRHRMDPPSYAITAAATLAAGLGMLFLQSTGRRPARLFILPQFHGRFWREYLSIGMAWSITGIAISIIPSELHRRGLGGFAGHAVFLVNGSGALMAPLARKCSAETNLRTGYILLPLGFAVLCLGIAIGSLAGLFLGAMVVGSSCYGFTYYGGLSRVNSVAQEQRAKSVSGFFLSAYLGFGFTALLLGWFSDRVGIMPSLIAYGLALLVTCIGLAWSGRYPISARNSV
jgi:MFS family permease